MMLATAKKNDQDEMLNNDMENSQNGSGEVDMNGDTNCKSSKFDITSSLNDDAFDTRDDTDDIPKLNGDSDPNDWLSSSSSDSESEPERNTIEDELPEQPLQHLSNESSHCERTDSPPGTNGSINGSTTQIPVNKPPLTKKVRPLKICFGVKNSVNGLKVKNSKKTKSTGSKVHYIERPPRLSDESDQDHLSEPEPEPEPEYAQYVGLKPSVKFKCSRCGVKNLASMALLNEHMASCDGQTPLTVSAAVSSSSVLNGGDETSTNLKITRKVFLCSSCGTYYQSYDLYIHMREIHGKQICLVCFNMFGKSQQLCDHLLAAHNLKLGEYTSVLQIRNAYKGSFYITCCTCNRLFSEDEPFDQHKCEPDLVPVPQQPQPRLSCEVAENTTSSSVTRDIITDNKLPYSNRSPVADSPIRVDHLSQSYSEPEPEPEPEPASPEVPVLSLPPARVDLSEERDESGDEYTQSQPTRDVDVDEDTSAANESTESVLHDEQYSPRESSQATPSIAADESMVTEPDPEPELEPDPEPTIDDTIPEPEPEREPSPVSEYPEPSTTDKSEELPEPESNAIEPQQPGPVTNEFSDNDSINATPDRTIEPEEASGEAGFDTSAILADEEKVAQPLPMALMLDETVASLDAQTLIKECVRTSCTDCAYCHTATLIRINGHQLGTHLLTEHRYKPTKNEDDSEQVEQKIRTSLADLQDVFLSASSSTEFQGTFSCFHCSYSTTLLRELCAHNRKSHQMTIFLCCICKCSFIYYSELLCHECPGEYSYDVHSLKYRCCYCPREHLPSAFRLMVHLRKNHKSCNFCLLRYNDQHELFTHMTKQHKMPHLCYKCNIAYRSRNDISKHLFWKHGTESVLCQRCLQKKWPHTYHFCIPGSAYTCEECSRVFSKPVALTVHRRAHNGEFPFTCENCDQRFISKRLLAAHRRITHPELCKPEELIDPSSAKQANETEPSKPDENSDNGDPDAGTTTGDAADGKKQRRKKKRKKEKPVNEKPLLDELPPLNLSSESDDESGADDESPAKDQDPATATSSPKPSAASSPQPATNEETRPETCGAPPSPIPDESAHIDKAADGNTSQDPATSAESEIPALAESLIDMANRLTKLARPPSPDKERLEKERLEKEFIEKALNCVLIEHSYCIPEAIFHSAGVDLNNSLEDDTTTTTSKQNRNEGSVSPARSHHRHDDSTNKTNDDSCCKSASSTTNTPRKRKHAKNAKTSSGDSSSSSSSDSDSSSSSCGSNCSCNRSNSGSSSSSSAASDCSTTPEKKKTKKSKRERDEEEEKRTQHQREQMFLLDARESDLDTEVSSAGEEFYEERPCYVPPPQTTSVSVSSQLQQQQVAAQVEPSVASQRQRLQYENDNQKGTTKTTKNRKDKKKKRKRIKLSLRLPSKGPKRQPVPNNEFTNPELLRQLNAVEHRPQQIHQQYHQYHQQYRDEKPPIPISAPGGGSIITATTYNSVHSSMAENSMSHSDGGTMLDSTGPGDDSNSRLSKRKRVKNKFYGYSSDEEARRDSSAPKSAPKKRVLTKKPNPAPKNRQFIGIRAKLSPSSKRLSVSVPFVPLQYPIPETPPVPSMNTYRSPQRIPTVPATSSTEPYNPYKNRYSSSEDSDSDEKRHTLVINLPNPMKDRRMNNSSSYKSSPAQPPQPPATYSDESMSSNSYVSSPRHQTETQQQAASAAAAAAAIRSQQLYRARMGTAGGPMGIGGSTNSPLKNSEKLYCYCQCPYDEVSEMIGCDAPNCNIEWFHFECVGIMVPPKGKWYCPSCRRNRENLSRFV